MTTITIRRDDVKIEGVTQDDDFHSAVELFVELGSKLFDVECSAILHEHEREDDDRDTSSRD
jgi:hypothetical protein